MGTWGRDQSAGAGGDDAGPPAVGCGMAGCSWSWPRGEDREREEGLVGKENERRGSRSQSGTSGLAAEVWDGS